MDSTATQGAGLRERKKHHMRRLLSDTATEMFLDRGFDSVRVVEVAEACGVSEKTVYNYFPTKESLLLDRWDTTMDSLRTGLADPAVPPVRAALRILGDELGGITAWLAAQDDPVGACVLFQRFGAMVGATPALRAHQREMTERLVAVAAEALAARVGSEPDDPEPQIAATALIGLWQVQSQSLRRHMERIRTPTRLRRAVIDDTERAARLIEAGLSALGAVDPSD